METLKSESTEAGPSITALFVVMGFMRSLEMGNGYLFDKKDLELVKHFVREGITSQPYSFNWGLIKLLSILPYSMQQAFFHKFLIPGYDHLILLRKLLIRNKVKSAIQSGVKQVVFLGGGYDPRAFLTSLAYKDVVVYELDRGQTRQSKLKALEYIPKGIGFESITINNSKKNTFTVNKNLHYIECDLIKDNLLDILTANGFQRGIKTLMIAEGLTMYLSKEENQRVLASIHHLLNEGDELLISFSSKVQYNATLKASLGSSKELYHFSLPPQEVISFASECGFEVIEKQTSTVLLERLGDTSSATFYKKNPNRPKEHYYLLRKSSSVASNKKIDEIPDMMRDIPNKLR